MGCQPTMTSVCWDPEATLWGRGELLSLGQPHSYQHTRKHKLSCPVDSAL